MDVAKLRAVVTADTKQASSALRQFSDEVDRTAQESGKLDTANQQAGKSTASFATQMQKSAKVAATMGAAITAGVIVPTGLVAKAAIQSGISFESAFTGVQKTVNATDAQLATLRQGIRDMALEIPASAVEIAAVAEAAGQLGIETPNILDFTRVMVDLGNTTNLSADQAATALARLANVTQMPQDQFDELGSTIVALGNNFATTEAEIVEMGLRIAGAGAQIGLTEPEILGVATALSSVGIEAEAGGSAISRVMVEMANAVASGTDELETMADVAGMSVGEFQRLFKEDVAEAVVTFVEGLGRVSEEGENVFAVLEELGFSEIRVRDALLRMAGAGDVAREAISMGSEAWRENVALTNEAAQRYEETAAKIQVFKNQLTDAGITVFDRLQSSIKRMLDDLTRFTQSAEFDAILDDFATDLEGVADDLSAFIQNDLPDLAAALGDVASAGVDTVQFMGDLVTKANEVNNAFGGDGWKVLLALYAGWKFGGVPGAITAGSVGIANEQSQGREGTTFGRIGSEIIGLPGSQHWEDTLFDDFFQLLRNASDQVIPDYMSALVAAEGEQQRFSDQSQVMAADMVDALLMTEHWGSRVSVATTDATDAMMMMAGYTTQTTDAYQDQVDAIQQLASGLDIAHIINASWNNSVAEAAQNVSHWEGMTSSAQSALDILNQRIADGIPLSEEQQEQYNLLTRGVERYKGGVEDQQDAFIKAEADRVRYTEGLDLLNQQLKDSAIDQDTYNQRVAELAEGIDPAIVSQANLQTATEQLYGKMEDLVDVIYRIMEALGLLPEEEHIEFTAGLEPFEQALSDVEGTDPEDKTVTVDANTEPWQDGWDPVVTAETDPKVVEIDALTDGFDAGFSHIEALQVTPKIGDFGADINDWQLDYDTVENAELSDKTAYLYADETDAMAGINTVQGELAALDGRSATVYVSVQTADTANALSMLPQYASGGRVPHDQLALVGEEGPELVMLPGGAEVLNAATTRGMISNASGGLGFTLTAHLDIDPALDQLYELDRYLPHSPAERGPFSAEPNWRWVFQGIEEAARDAFKDAENEAELFAAHMEQFQVWDFTFGNFEAIVTGDKIEELNDLARLLSAQLAAALERDAPPEIVAGIQAALDAVRQQVGAAMALAGTDAAQAWAEAFAQEQHAEARFDWWMDTIPNLDRVIADGDLDRWEQAVKVAERNLEFAREAGAPADVLKQLEQDLAVAENNLAVAGTMLAKALREGWISELAPMTDETLDQILAMMDDLDKKVPGGGAKLAEDLLDELVAGLYSGRVDLEQALEIIPRELLDSLEEMERALIVDLAEALAIGSENAEVLQEQLRILDELLDGVRDSAVDAALAVGTFVPGRGYYYSEGTFTTGDPNAPGGTSGNILDSSGRFMTAAEHKANQANVTVELDGRVLSRSTSKSFTENHRFTARMGLGGPL